MLLVAASEYNETEYHDATALWNHRSSAMHSTERDLRWIYRHPETIGKNRIDLRGSSFREPERHSAGLDLA